MKLHWSPKIAAAHVIPIKTKIENPPLWAKKPDANKSESPGKNGKKTTPVSIKIIKSTNPYAANGPAAMAAAIAERGSRSSEIIASINPISSNPDMVASLYMTRRPDSPFTLSKSALSRYGCP